MGNVREVMQRIASEHPLPVKEYEAGEGEGPFTREILEARLEAWKQGSDKPFDYCDTDRKNGFRITCPGDSEEGWPDGEAHSDVMDDLTDATIVWVENGWPKYMCRHAHCDEGAAHGKKTWADLQNFYDSERKLHAIEDEEELVLDPDLVEEEPLQAPAEVSTGEGAVVSTRTVKQERARVREAISDIRKIPAKESPTWEKAQRISELIYASLRQTGKLYNVGNVATYLDKDTREITQVAQKDPRFTELLIEYGIYPSDTNLTNGVGQFLGAKAVRAPECTIYAGSFYDATKHVLYVNEWHGSILRITGDGKVERIRNGDDGLLWNDGKMAKADPLKANIEYLAPADVTADAAEDGPTSIEALMLNEESLIKRFILDTINYDEITGVKKEHAQIILAAAILGLFFIERIPSYPFIYFFGAGGSMKTSLAVKVGRLLQGREFRATPATTEEDDLKIMAINNSFLLLDEANNLKKLQNVMKAIATGAQDIRRELYTTTTQRISQYMARIWMTANTTDTANETVSSRMMIIDAAARTEAEPYRSEHYLNQEWGAVTQEWPDNLRNAIWSELVRRLAGAMKTLGDADSVGEGDLRVPHRMSSFFVFGLAIAKREGLGQLFKDAMDAMDKRQTASNLETNEIVHLIESLPCSYNMEKMPNGGWRGMRTAKEWADILGHAVPEANRQLKADASRVGWVRWQFNNNEHTLVKAVGMKTDSTMTEAKNRIKVYGFTGCNGDNKLPGAGPGYGDTLEEDEPPFMRTPEVQAARKMDSQHGDALPTEQELEAMSETDARSKPAAIAQEALQRRSGAKPEPHLCECGGCKHCDPKDTDRGCARRSKSRKCSACRNVIPAELVEEEGLGSAGVVPRNGEAAKPKMGVFDLGELEDK